MEIITKEEVLKLYDNQELSDDEIEDVYGGVNELQKCIGRCIEENKDDDKELERLRTIGCWAQKCFLD